MKKDYNVSNIFGLVTFFHAVSATFKLEIVREESSSPAHTG